MQERIRTAIWDIETDGLLPELTRVHILVIRDYERRKTYVFRRTPFEDTIEIGLAMLEEAEFCVGQNIIGFDLPALDKVYADINITGKIRDTLVMARMCFSDQKEKDFRLHEKGKLPGALIGAHGLEAWGHRFGLHKGDYSEMMKEKARALGMTDEAEINRFVWAEWNQEMEDYAINDVDITVLLYEKIIKAKWDDRAVVLEHEIHDLMAQQERNGIYFNVDDAEKLAYELQAEAELLRSRTVEHFGKWWVPDGKKVVKALWDDPDGINKAKKYEKPDAALFEDASRAVWGKVVYPAKSRIMVKGNLCPVHYSVDAPFCKVKLKEFNPGSRQQIVDRLVTVYNWHPVDFTDTGNPEVSDSVLRKLTHVPMALELAELFYYNKTLGQLATGPTAWLKKVTPEGKIHGYVNVGGTVSGRASHVSPNLAQVKKVKFKKDKDGKTYLAKGRDGDHGWECRSLFGVKEGWTLTGIDLEGIELRCFGEKLRKFDGGEYLAIVLGGDPHTHNQKAAGLPTRDNAKTFIYALLYGAGDIKLGSIVAPLADEDEQRAIGARLRAQFMKEIPAFKRLTDEIKMWARKGYLPGLDGRRLFVRSPHSAMNTLLQSDAAIIAKKWVLLTRDYLEDDGLVQGWDGDFANLLWIHDETQIGSRTPQIANIVEEYAVKAAADAGRFLGYECPIAAKPKSGLTWAETH